MKSSVKLYIKVIVLFMFLYFTPFYTGVKYMMQDSKSIMNHLVYHQETIQQNVDLKGRLNVLSYNKNLTLPKEEITIETTSEQPQNVPQENSTANHEESTSKAESENKQETDNEPAVEANGKKIYIYNTHQEEGYEGGKTVMDAAAILGAKLEKKGYKVVLETNSFNAYANANGMDYNSLYLISNKYLNDALVNYGGFDLCLDFHRDSIPRESSYITIDDKTYAKAMMVIGGLSVNVNSATSLSTTLTDIVNSKKNGIMKSPMTRDGYYNQQVHENILLMEVGGDVNTFEEVCNSIDIISESLDELLKSR